MLRNIEIKVRLSDPQAMFERVSAMADSGPIELVQEDTYYKHDSVRCYVKFRALSGTEGQVIINWRSPVSEPGMWLSRYYIIEAGGPLIFTVILERAWDVLLHLSKRRWAFQCGNVQIHIDDVKNLGWFVEVEAGLTMGDPCEPVIEQVREVMGCLGLSIDGAIPGSYLDIWERDGTYEIGSAAAVMDANHGSPFRIPAIRLLADVGDYPREQYLSGVSNAISSPKDNEHVRGPESAAGGDSGAQAHEVKVARDLEGPVRPEADDGLASGATESDE